MRDFWISHCVTVLVGCVSSTLFVGTCIPKGAVEVTPDVKAKIASPEAKAEDGNAASPQAVISTVRQANEQQKTLIKDVEKVVVEYGIPRSTLNLMVYVGGACFVLVVLILVYQFRQMSAIRSARDGGHPRPGKFFRKSGPSICPPPNPGVHFGGTDSPADADR